MRREEGLSQLRAWVTSPSLLRHSFVVECVMRAAALRYGGGAEDVEIWGIAGLLHDADYELAPTEHPARIVAWLRDQGEESIAHAVAAHGTCWKVPYESPLDRALVACDELCGFVVACGLARPDGLLSLTAERVMKKLNDLRFASGVDRNEVHAGVQILGVDLKEHIQFVLDAIRPHAATFGLSGEIAITDPGPRDVASPVHADR